jgi:uncharacterized protein YegJ (DUF2314 family)
LPGDDSEIAEAAKRAVATFKYLWRELTWEYRRIIPGLELSAIKAAFKDPGRSKVEHMWLSEIYFDGEIVSAKLLNSPNELTSVKEGDEVSLRLDQIDDWMYAIDGRVFGGFSIHVLRARMSASERRAHDKAWGFDFGHPGVVSLVPNWNDLGRKSLLGRLFGGSAAPADPDAEHPMSENMAQRFAEEPEARDSLSALGPRGLNALHSLALGGSAACVKALLEAGVDPHIPTRSGKTALELATLMAWPRVIELLREAQSARDD